MSFDNRFYAEAENEMEALRDRNKRERAMREQALGEKYPDIGRIVAELSTTSGKIFTLIADRPSDVKERLAQIERDNIELQGKLMAALLRYGFRSDYLDPIYSCRKCKDTGIVDGKRCSCFMDKVKRAAAKALNDSSPMSLCSFGDFNLTYYDDKDVLPLGCTARELMSDNFEKCKSYAEDFHLPCDSIFMYGGTGLGKTHLSLSIAAAVLDKGYNAVYGSAPDLFRVIEKEHFGEGDSGMLGTLEMLEQADLLILDDVGAEFEKKFYSSALYNILNSRMNTFRPTIVSTNLTLNELRERYGDRVFSRLMTMRDMPFAGKDIRIQKRMNTVSV